MIKKCKVIMSNSEVTVVEFDNKKVQLSEKNITSKFVYVKHDRTYSIVSKKEYDEYKNRQLINDEANESKKIYKKSSKNS